MTPNITEIVDIAKAAKEGQYLIHTIRLTESLYLEQLGKFTKFSICMITIVCRARIALYPSLPR